MNSFKEGKEQKCTVDRIEIREIDGESCQIVYELTVTFMDHNRCIKGFFETLLNDEGKICSYDVWYY